MSLVIDMMLKYPSILPLNPEHTEFQGFLPVNGIDYKIHIKYEGAKPTLILNQQLNAFNQEILQLSSSSSILTYLDGLTEIIKSKTGARKHKNLSETYRHVLNEYVELRRFYIGLHKCAIVPDLSEIRISHSDEWGRVHDLVINADFKDTIKIFRVAQHDLPDKNIELFRSDHSLKGIYEQFVGYIEKLQPFFDVMDSLDRSCWILDPEKPSRKDCYRRIGLDVNASMVVTVDPWSDANQMPNIKFLGPERLVQGFRNKMGDNLLNWDSKGDLVQEILRVLDLPHFPTRPEEAYKEEIVLCNTGECCICFSLRFNDKLPEIICQNPSCELVFHQECLYQWLVSTSAQKRFNELHGQCPNCEKHITCPL